MKLGIMQPYFFPYIGYFQLIAAVDVFLLYEHVSFRKRSWINRNRLLDKGTGKSFYFRVPLKNQSSNKKIGEVEIDNATPWRRQIISFLLYNYKEAPFFDENFSVVKEIVMDQSDRLHEYNSRAIQQICNYLGIQTKIVYDGSHSSFSELEKNIPAHALENELENKSQRIISLCNYFGCHQYINLPGGKALYSKKEFEKFGLTLYFIEPDDFEYRQFHHPFQPYLSILDVLFHTGRNETSNALRNIKLT